MESIVSPPLAILSRNCRVSRTGTGRYLRKIMIVVSRTGHLRATPSRVAVISSGFEYPGRTAKNTPLAPPGLIYLSWDHVRERFLLCVARHRCNDCKVRPTTYRSIDTLFHEHRVLRGGTGRFIGYFVSFKRRQICVSRMCNNLDKSQRWCDLLVARLVTPQEVVNAMVIK